MSFIGTAGVVAQQGNQAAPATAPTDVSIATGSSGNYDESFTVVDATSCGFGSMNVGPIQFSSNAITHSMNVAEFDAFDGCSSNSLHKFLGYIRATGATSFLWDLSLTSSSLSSGTATVEGTASTAQDCTSSGVGEILKISFGGGRGGQTYPSAGDSIVVTLRATATNSTGDTDATNCVLTYNFIGS
jgi:hypothetical protein